jgi:hypothetical protein
MKVHCHCNKVWTLTWFSWPQYIFHQNPLLSYSFTSTQISQVVSYSFTSTYTSQVVSYSFTFTQISQMIYSFTPTSTFQVVSYSLTSTHTSQVVSNISPPLRSHKWSHQNKWQRGKINLRTLGGWHVSNTMDNHFNTLRTSHMVENPTSCSLTLLEGHFPQNINISLLILN